MVDAGAQLCCGGAAEPGCEGGKEEVPKEEAMPPAGAPIDPLQHTQ